MDPYQVLNVPREFTIEQLRYNYKVLARKLHPDKCCTRITREQANATFQLLTEAYRALLQVHSTRVSDRPFHELRSESRPADPYPAPPSTSLTDAVKGFNPSRFNDEFERNRLAVPEVDAGYGDWMKTTEPGAEDDGGRRRTAVIKYVDPSPLAIAVRRGGVGFSELGVERVEDYSSGQVDERHGGIKYTDYRLAHSTGKLLDESAIKARREFRSLDELQTHRANISYTMSDRRAQAMAERAQKAEEAEHRRVDVQQRYDKQMADHFDRVHRKLLGFAPT
jgi:curved DNA-binding protein CbpA